MRLATRGKGTILTPPNRVIRSAPTFPTVFLLLHRSVCLLCCTASKITAVTVLRYLPTYLLYTTSTLHMSHFIHFSYDTLSQTCTFAHQPIYEPNIQEEKKTSYKIKQHTHSLTHSLTHTSFFTEFLLFSPRKKLPPCKKIQKCNLTLTKDRPSETPAFSLCHYICLARPLQPCFGLAQHTRREFSNYHMSILSTASKGWKLKLRCVGLRGKLCNKGHAQVVANHFALCELMV